MSLSPPTCLCGANLYGPNDARCVKCGAAMCPECAKLRGKEQLGPECDPGLIERRTQQAASVDTSKPLDLHQRPIGPPRPR